MPKREHIDDILKQWPYDPQTVSVRLRRGKDGREVIQMRIDMGLLQLETTGRPDGCCPKGAETYFDFLLRRTLGNGQFVLDEDECSEVDREFVQYYHRRICWLRLHEYRRAVDDADHTLSLMDFCREHSPDEHWTMSHEQYRPFVIFQRTQAAALAELEENGPEAALKAIDNGLQWLKTVFAEHDLEDHFDEDELVQRLREFRHSLLEQYDPQYNLRLELQDAIAEEKYELAARLRDEIAERESRRR